MYKDLKTSKIYSQEQYNSLLCLLETHKRMLERHTLLGEVDLYEQCKKIIDNLEFNVLNQIIQID